ncbi:hypothetical protein [Citrobacter amalonaticus]|uniref:hypothetical protein n=1 Tax=Citrobacter amalonaticus TaxID=35703 RepID=UPI003567AB32
MELTNVPAPQGVWTQVYDGTAESVIAISGTEAYICQSTAAPDEDLIGLPFSGMSLTQYIYRATSGTPVYVKPLNADAIIIVNA